MCRPALGSLVDQDMSARIPGQRPFYKLALCPDDFKGESWRITFDRCLVKGTNRRRRLATHDGTSEPNQKTNHHRVLSPLW